MPAVQSLLRSRGGAYLLAVLTSLGVRSDTIASAQAAVIEVPSDAAPTVQAGIELAQSGDTVLIAPGTYYEAIDFLGKSITVEGAAGAEKTILDATGLGSSVVTVNSGEGEGTTLRGLTITGGVGSPPENYVRHGGGVYVFGAALVLEACIIENCTPTTGPFLHGGGLAARNGAFVTVVGCTIRDNSASRGGGLYIDGAQHFELLDSIIENNSSPYQRGGGLYASNSASEPMYVRIEGCEFCGNVAKWAGAIALYASAEIKRCTFDGNQASGDDGGGAMFISANMDVDLSQSTFSGNSAKRGGAIRNEGALTVANCTFTENTATQSGGAISAVVQSFINSSSFHGNSALYGGAVSSTAKLILDDCSFTLNSATAGGGAAHGSNAVHAANCSFTDNSVPGGARGGGLYVGGNSALTQCTFQGNSASDGGGIYAAQSILLKECTFASNQAIGTGYFNGSGGGLYATAGAQIQYCSFTDNQASRQGGGAHIAGGGGIVGSIFRQNSASSEYAGGGVSLEVAFAWDHANVTATVFDGNSGGGLSLLGYRSSIVADCTFTDNQTLPPVTGGAGLQLFECVSTVTNCTFLDNTAESDSNWNGYGGAVLVQGPSSDDVPGRVMFADCLFQRNHAWTAGGGVMLYWQQSDDPDLWPLFENCRFQDNIAGLGGGMEVGLNGRVEVRNCTFEQNASDDAGGGAWLSQPSKARFTDCLFTANSANDGGALVVTSPDHVITTCTFVDNFASERGGALHLASSLLSHCIFTGNTASLGGAVYSENNSTIYNCDLSGNTASGQGGAVYGTSTGTLIRNSTLCANTPDNLAGVYIIGPGNIISADCPPQSTHQVPSEYGTIQKAIDAAVHGDLILVAPGTYNEAINFLGKRLVLHSSHGAVTTIIDASDYNTSTVKVVSGEAPGTALRGFTITGGTGTPWPSIRAGGGVLIEGADIEVEDCIITQNTATSGGGVCLRSIANSSILGRLVLRNCIVSHNTATGGGGIRTLASTQLDAITCRVEGNIASNSGGGAFLSGIAALAECEFRGNIAMSGGGVTAGPPPLTIGNSLFCDNAPEHVYTFSGEWNDNGENKFLDDCPVAPAIGDLNGDGVVDGADLLILLAAWGPCPPPQLASCSADLDSSGWVDVLDLLLLLANWG